MKLIKNKNFNKINNDLRCEKDALKIKEIEYIKLKEENEKLNIELKNIKNDYENIKEKNNILEEKISILKSNEKNYLNEQSFLLKNNRNINNINIKMEKEYSSMKDDLVFAKNENLNLLKKSLELQEECKKLTKYINEVNSNFYSKIQHDIKTKFLEITTSKINVFYLVYAFIIIFILFYYK